MQEGLTHVRNILNQRRHQKSASGREVMITVDNLKRLCIDHYFVEEIQSAMDVACMDLLHSDDLLDATLSFRLMREAGHDVSADDVLRKFTGDAGEFKLALSKDIRGLLSLHDMSHLSIGGEALLHKAKRFSSKHLASAIRHLEPGLARYVRQSLDHPYHLSLMQYKARHHLSYMQTLPNRDTAAMEELAAAEFQLNKLMHRKEMQEVTRWWVDLGLAQEIPEVRDQVLKWYMWSMTAIQGASFSRHRVEIAKIISLFVVVDDILDVIATTEELSLFTEAVKMWNTTVANSLPSCMRACYMALYTVTNEIADMVEKEHGLNPLNHLRKAWAVLFDGFMLERKWLLAIDQVPTAEEYLRNGVITSGVPLAFAHYFVLLGNNQSNEALSDDIHYVISCAAKIIRLWNDIVSAEDEPHKGLDGSYRDLYLMENPRCSLGDVEAHMRGLIACEWEELNRECFCRRTFSSSFTQACLNLARMTGVMYSYDKEHRLLILEEYTRMLLL
ncbi:hypothetical protein U9M48_025882 [Paspalum notatum var. saurae]|uniref:Uncharacterized protein n=1 Tax=Paspalum notatum var. saurae TaxID=547442 RepID=A0AAQ3TR25_PASNO